MKENKIEKEKSESGKDDCVRAKLCTRTPGGKSNNRSAPVTHSQQNKIGVPPILELNNTSFGNRRTIAHLDFPSESGCNISRAA